MCADNVKNDGGRAGFTLIEVLVVTAIIGLLSVIVLVSIRVARDRAAVARLQADAKSIITQISVRRLALLKDLTGNSCTMCWFDVNMRVNDQPAMVNKLDDAWAKIGFVTSPIDPWGTPYLINENEEVDPDPSKYCKYDLIYSAGGNGYWEGIGSFDATALSPGIPQPSNAGDDYVFAVDFGKSCSAPVP